MKKRAAIGLFGAAMFLAGAFVAAPKAEADKEAEALRVLCERFEKTVAAQLESVQRISAETAGADTPMSWSARSEVRTLSAMRRVVCGK